MTNEAWVVLLVVAAALLPAALLGLVFLGDRILGHRRYRELRWRLYEFQRDRPAAYTFATAVLGLPAVAYFVANSSWLIVAAFVLQVVIVYYGSTRAVPPFSDEFNGGGRLTPIRPPVVKRTAVSDTD